VRAFPFQDSTNATFYIRGTLIAPQVWLRWYFDAKAGPAGRCTPSQRGDFLLPSTGRHLPIGEVPDAKRTDRGERTSFSTRLPAASTIRRTCRLRPSVKEISINVARTVAQTPHLGRARRAVAHSMPAAAGARVAPPLSQRGGFRLVGFCTKVSGAGDVVGEGSVVGHQQQGRWSPDRGVRRGPARLQVRHKGS